jgi:hypothetical protein
MEGHEFHKAPHIQNSQEAGHSRQKVSDIWRSLHGPVKILKMTKHAHIMYVIFNVTAIIHYPQPIPIKVSADWYNNTVLSKMEWHGGTKAKCHTLESWIWSAPLYCKM